MQLAKIEQIVSKLDHIDQKLSALLVSEEKPTKEELKAIRAGQKDFAAKKFESWEQIKTARK